MTTKDISLPAKQPVNVETLSLVGRLRVGTSLWMLRAKEYATCDSSVIRWLLGTLAYSSAMLLGWLGQAERRFKLLCSLHRADVSPAAKQLAESLVRQAAAGQAPQVKTFLERHVANVARTSGTARFFDDPTRLLGAAAIVLKSPQHGEKGLLYAHYNHVFPLLAKFYDLETIAARYNIVIEPSWTGFCDSDLLGYCNSKFPVFVTAYEPRDAEFIRSTQSNLIPMPIAANWWVDYRNWRPIPGIEKDVDVVMVAGWGSYKRHHRFFNALSRLRRQGHKLRAMLIGYSVGWPKEIVLKHAKYYGVEDQLEIKENVPYEQVNELVNRAKIGVLWSRKEGFNRAIIECMFAGVPSIMRTGFNYGYKYPYINDQTGCFADEKTLSRKMLELIECSAEMDPRSWVLENMSCQRATQIMSDAIGTWSAVHDEPWTQPPVVKVTHLHSMQYWDAADTERFKADYEWLNGKARSQFSNKLKSLHI